METKEKIKKRMEFLENITFKEETPKTITQKKDKMNHKYVKNFSHLINIINAAIANNENEINMDEIMDDADFIFAFVYKQPFCDQYTWLINHERPDLLLTDVIKKELVIYNQTNKFCGKRYGKTVINLPEYLKDK